MNGQRASGCVAALGAVDALVTSLERSARRAEARTGLTNPELFVLHELRRDDGIPLSVAVLAMRARTGRRRVAPIVERLSALGLVQSANHGNGRRRGFVLTSAGRRLADRSPSAPTADLIAALSTLPARQLGELSRGLDALSRALGSRQGRGPAHTTQARLLFEDGAGPAVVGKRRRVAAG